MDNTLSFLISLHCDFQTRINLLLTCKSTLYLLESKELWIHNLMKMNCRNLSEFDTKKLVNIHRVLSLGNYGNKVTEENLLSSKLLLDLGIYLSIPSNSRKNVPIVGKINSFLRSFVNDDILYKTSLGRCISFGVNDGKDKLINEFEELYVENMITIYGYIKAFSLQYIVEDEYEGFYYETRRINSHELLTDKVYNILKTQHIYDDDIFGRALKLQDFEYIRRYIVSRGIGSKEVKRVIYGLSIEIHISVFLMLCGEKFISGSGIQKLSKRIITNTLSECIYNNVLSKFFHNIDYIIYNSAFRMLIRRNDLTEEIMCSIFDFYEDIEFFINNDLKLFPSFSVIYVEESLKRGYYKYPILNEDTVLFSIETIEIFYKYGRLDGSCCYSSYSNCDNLTLLDMILYLSDINLSRRQILTHCVNKFGYIDHL